MPPNPTPSPGSDAPAPATFGGPGFRHRTGSHAEEVGQRRLWGPCGVHNDADTLRRVLLHRPGDELRYPEPPDHWLMLERPDLDNLRRQADAVAEAYARWGAEVCWTTPPHAPPPPNLLFMRDTFWMTPEGAILARMGSAQRAGEEAMAAQALASARVPLLGLPRGDAIFEGADALWLSPTCVAIGLGRRSNLAFLEQLRQHLLPDPALEWIAVPLPPQSQHLLGVLNLLGPQHAAIWEGRTPPALADLLEQRGWRILRLPDGPELSQGRAMNWVCLGPGAVLMPHDCPDTARRLREAGVEVRTVNVSEYRKAGGALGCLTGILWRHH